MDLRDLYVWYTPLGIFWWIFIAGFSCLHLCYHFPNLPLWFKDLTTYGKVRDCGSRSWDKILSLPKRYFLHFYLVSFIWNAYVLLLLVWTLCIGGRFPKWLHNLLQFISLYPDNEANHFSILLAQLLIFLQAFRRVFETAFISVFSDAKIHLAHYLLGYAFYLLLSFSSLSGGPDLSKRVSSAELWDIQWYHLVGVNIFIWASIHHHRAHVIFASLRQKDSESQVYKIPHGDWFEYVTCPHYLAEIIIYFSILLVLGVQHKMWMLVVFFTATNQILAARHTHRWYLHKFQAYPRNRTAIIPFLL